MLELVEGSRLSKCWSIDGGFVVLTEAVMIA